MFPKFEDTQELEKVQTLGKSFQFDFTNRKFVFINGYNAVITGDSAIKEWVTACINTANDKYQIYEGTSFGTNIKNYIGYKNTNEGFVISEFKRELAEALLTSPYIEDVDISINFDMQKTMLISVIINYQTEVVVSIQ